MRELPATSDGGPERDPATSPPAPEPAADNGAPTFDAIAPKAALAMEQFIWPESKSDATPTPDANKAAENAVPDEAGSIFAALRPEPMVLPRIAAAAAPAGPREAPERGEHWRRQLITALREVDDDAPIPDPSLAPAPPRLPAVYAVPAGDPRDDRRTSPAYLLPAATRASRVAGRVLTGVIAATCILSTGVLWATHRSETASVADPLPTVTAALREPEAASGEPAGQPMLNTPVLVREGESFKLAPGADTEAWLRRPVTLPVPPTPAPPAASAPEPPAPQSPIIHRPVTVHTVPTTVSARAPAPVERPAPITLQPPDDEPQLDRAALEALVAEPPGAPEATPEPPAVTPSRGPHATDRRRTDAPSRAYNDTRITEEAYQSRGPGSARARGDAAPRIKWEGRRQGLRTTPQPEPEPSTLKKLIGMVWPGSSATKAPAAKPASRAAPAAPVHRRDWSDSAQPDP